MAKQTKKTVTLFGNLGADPRLHQIPARTETRNVYDPIIDDVVEKNFDRKAQEFRTFSLAVSAECQEETRWIHCIDWAGNANLFRKGDRVRLTGYFQVRAYKKDGEDKRIRQFVVETANLERAKIRHENAASLLLHCRSTSPARARPDRPPAARPRRSRRRRRGPCPPDRRRRRAP